MYCFMTILKNLYFIPFTSLKSHYRFFFQKQLTAYPIQNMNSLCLKTQDAYSNECLFSLTSYVFTYSCKKRLLGSNIMQNAFNSHLRTSNRIFKNNTCKNAFSRMIMTLQTITKINSNVYAKILLLYVIPGRCLFYCSKKNM